MLLPGSMSTPLVVERIALELLDIPQRIFVALVLSASNTTPIAFAGAAVEASVVVTERDPLNNPLALTGDFVLIVHVPD